MLWAVLDLFVRVVVMVRTNVPGQKGIATARRAAATISDAPALLHTTRIGGVACFEGLICPRSYLLLQRHKPNPVGIDDAGGLGVVGNLMGT